MTHAHPVDLRYRRYFIVQVCVPIFVLLAISFTWHLVPCTPVNVVPEQADFIKTHLVKPPGPTLPSSLLFADPFLSLIEFKEDPNLPHTSHLPCYLSARYAARNIIANINSSSYAAYVQQHRTGEAEAWHRLPQWPGNRSRCPTAPLCLIIRFTPPTTTLQENVRAHGAKLLLAAHATTVIAHTHVQNQAPPDDLFVRCTTVHSTSASPACAQSVMFENSPNTTCRTIPETSYTLFHSTSSNTFSQRRDLARGSQAMFQRTGLAPKPQNVRLGCVPCAKVISSSLQRAL